MQRSEGRRKRGYVRRFDCRSDCGLRGRSCFDRRPEAFAVFHSHLEKRRLHLWNGRITKLVGTDLKARELLEYLRHWQGNLRGVFRADFAAKELGRLLVNGTQPHRGSAARHTSLDFGGFEKNAALGIDLERAQHSIGNVCR